MELTNTEAFCISCHEMRDNPYKEKGPIHFKNRSGLRAICSDCHVPRDWLAKIKRKIAASNQLNSQGVGHGGYTRRSTKRTTRDGDARVGVDEGAQFNRVPQLSLGRGDGPAQAVACLAGHVRGNEDRNDVH